MQDHDPTLTYCASIYDALVQDAVRTFQQAGDHPETLEYVVNMIYGIGRYAYHIHPGRYADGSIENIALEIGQHSDSLLLSEYDRDVPQPDQPDTNVRRVLHVATELSANGGHARSLIGLIQQDSSSSHTVVLTSQPVHALSPFIRDNVTVGSGQIFSLHKVRTYMGRAKALRTLAEAWADMVILWVYPSDPIPVIAFADCNIPPVGLMNHADHTFWLGSAVADIIIDFRPYGSHLTKTRRNAQNTHILSLPLIPMTSVPPTRKEARRKLCIPDDVVMLCTMGTLYKYVPDNTYNFFRTAQHILERNPNARLYLIGMNTDQITSYLDPALCRDRIEGLGFIDDPSLYLTASDIYMEGFPYNSWLALFDAVVLDVCPVLMYNPASSQMSIAEDPSLNGLVSHAHDEGDYIEWVTRLINEPEIRIELGRRCGQSVRSHHQGEQWHAQLDAIYTFLEQNPHRFQKLEVAVCRYDEDDINRSHFSYNTYSGDPLVHKAVPLTLTFKHLISLLGISIRLKDTRLCIKHIIRWTATYIRRVLWRRYLSG